MYEYKTKPFEHQRQALILGAEKKVFAYLMEMGTGKTKVSIDNAAYLYQLGEISLCVVIAPNSVYQNWKDEIHTHCPSETHIFTYKIDKHFAFDEGKLNFLLMNVEAFSHKSGVSFLGKILDYYGKKTMMIVDESTTIKNRTAKRTKSLMKLGDKVTYRRILTGSPITKSPLDLFSQFQFLQKGILGTDNFFVFRAKHCVMRDITNTSGRRVSIPVSYINLEGLETKVKEHSYRTLKKDCLDLKPKVYTRRYVNLLSDQAEAYKELKDHARTVIKDDTVTYNNKLAEIIKLMQLTCGFYKSDTGEVKDLPSAKLNELLNVIEETSGKIIIWSHYIRTLENIIETLKTKYGTDSTVAFYGDTDTVKRPGIIQSFQNDDKVRFFVGNPQSAGFGLNLTEANTVIYFSNSFNLEERQQSEDRAHRAGQTGSVLYVDIVARNTIDEYILKSLQNKIQISAKTLGEEILDFL
jgi:SNF2 family DNA or RNA helicase